jgi:hypothetical protein
VRFARVSFVLEKFASERFALERVAAERFGSHLRVERPVAVYVGAHVDALATGGAAGLRWAEGGGRFLGLAKIRGS